MKSTNESVLESLDGSHRDILPYINYILQDLWEIGTDPNLVIEMISKHTKNHSELNVLDLGCGKGAVSVRVSEHFGCNCHGIDAFPEFIDFAKRKAIEYHVELICKFEVDDIREAVLKLPQYDVIILGSIGPVLGDYLKTLNLLNRCLNEDGIIIIDDGYVPDGSNYSHDKVLSKSELFEQINYSGMKVVDEAINDIEMMNENNKSIFRYISIRCNELIEMYPDKKQIFEEYLQSQEEENDAFLEKIICTMIVFKKNITLI